MELLTAKKNVKKISNKRNNIISFTSSNVKNIKEEEWICKHCGAVVWNDGGPPSPTAYPSCIYPRHFWIFTGKIQCY